ncbi:MAG TPA: TadE/TadG family type IV pilus assembly protein [Roseiarcus sp.]|jgi:Flp pilus assembly protein TadG|nr:TadE/TadG family type IV pilus assembly protein [Roseiarcus sp.]
MTSRGFLRDADGATAVEFALASPIFFLGLFGLAQVGLWLWADFSLQRAVDAASRCAAISCAADIKSYAVNATVGLPVSTSAFTVTSASCGSNSSKVAATYSVPTFVPALPDITVNVSACYPT